MQISAAVVQEIGAPFTLAEVDLQEPAPDEVVVQIAGVGICHTDIAVKEGHLPFQLPGVLGHEGSRGTAEIDGSDEAFRFGDVEFHNPSFGCNGGVDYNQVAAGSHGLSRVDSQWPCASGRQTWRGTWSKRTGNWR